MELLSLKSLLISNSTSFSDFQTRQHQTSSLTGRTAPSLTLLLTFLLPLLFALFPLSDVLCMSAFIKQDDLSCRCEAKVMTSPARPHILTLPLSSSVCGLKKDAASPSTNWSGFTSPQTGEGRWTEGLGERRRR